MHVRLYWEEMGFADEGPSLEAILGAAADLRRAPSSGQHLRAVRGTALYKEAVGFIESICVLS